MNKIFVVGAGTMGMDIAHVFAANGIKTTICDLSEDIFNKSKARLTKTLDKMVARERITQEKKETIIKNICFTSEHSQAADCDLVIEAIVEKVEAKKGLFSKLDAICGKDTIFASNTSAISITEIAAATTRADRFIGMHFFNPANVMALVEVIRGAGTSDETFRAVYNLVESVGKSPVEVAESAGFVVNRLLVPMINDAAMLYSESVASVEDIDKAMKLGANHPMGPLALGDFIGLDVCLAIMETLFYEMGDSKYRPAPLLRKMVRAGKLGKKTGEGFYKYN